MKYIETFLLQVFDNISLFWLSGVLRELLSTINTLEQLITFVLKFAIKSRRAIISTFLRVVLRQWGERNLISLAQNTVHYCEEVLAALG